MATKTPLKAPVPGGQALEPGQDLDTSEYVNEVGPHDHDLTTHPKYHEDKLHAEPLMDKIERLKVMRGGDDPERVIVTRIPNTRDGVVRLGLTYPDGDRFNGNGRTTAEAVNDLEQKLLLLYPPQEVTT